MSRHAWPTAYRSQFLDVIVRAHVARNKIKNTLIADLHPDEWEFPPKPKGMNWDTYNRLEKKFDKAEEAMDNHLLKFSAGLDALLA